jgi:hypothetical protein
MTIKTMPKGLVHSGYGGEGVTRWRVDPTADPVVVARAYLSSEVVGRVEARLTELGIDRDQFADLLGVNRRALASKFRGQHPVTLDDVIIWTLILGTEVLPPFPGRRQDLVPAEYRQLTRSWEGEGVHRRSFAHMDPSEVDWDQIGHDVSNEVTQARELAALHLISAWTIRTVVISSFLRLGVPPASVFLRDKTRTPGIALGSPPVTEIQIVCTDPEAGASKSAKDFASRIVNSVTRSAPGVVVGLGRQTDWNAARTALLSPSSAPDRNNGWGVGFTIKRGKRALYVVTWRHLDDAGDLSLGILTI